MIITDNFLYWDILAQAYLLLTLKATLQLLRPPKDRNEELLFSKLQFNFLLDYDCVLLQLNFGCLQTRTQNSTNVWYNFQNTSCPFIFISRRLWNCVYYTPFLILDGFRLPKSVFCHLREQRACSKLKMQLAGNNMECKYKWNYYIKSQPAGDRLTFCVAEPKFQFRKLIFFVGVVLSKTRASASRLEVSNLSSSLETWWNPPTHS